MTVSEPCFVRRSAKARSMVALLSGLRAVFEAVPDGLAAAIVTAGMLHAVPGTTVRRETVIRGH